MMLEFTQDQVLLKATVDRFFADRDGRRPPCHEAMIETWSEVDWTSFAELGLLALPFPEEFGGLAGGAVDLMIVMEAIGRSLAPEPYLATVILAGTALSGAGSPEQQRAYIERIVSGQTVLGLAHDEPGARYDLTEVTTEARKRAGRWCLSGRKRAVLGGDRAETIIVSARTAESSRPGGDISMFLVPADAPGLERRGFALLGGGGAADLVLRNVEATEDMLLGPRGEALPVLAQAHDAAIAALCAEAVGVMAAMHETTIEYLKTRRQFGAPIGSFQALQHRTVDMLIALEQARSMALLAALMVGNDDAAARTKAMAAAKIQIGRSGRFIGQQSVQLHGAIGMARECRIGSYFRRTTAIDALFGNADHHLSRLAGMDGPATYGRARAIGHKFGHWAAAMNHR